MSDFVPEVFGEWTLEKRRGDTTFYLARKGSDTEVWASAHSDDLNVENTDASFYSYPPIVSIERLLGLRRAALAPEAHGPSGEPWRPEVGDLCLYYFGRSWLRARRIADIENADDVGESFPQRFETIDAKTSGGGYLYCSATYDGIRPLGSLPVPPSCGGEIEPREQADCPAVASERPGLARLLEWADTMLGNEREAPREYPEGREDAFTDFVHEIEQEIAALGPPSIAEDLRAPEPGAFEGAVLVPWLTGSSTSADDEALGAMHSRFQSGNASVPQILGEAFTLGYKAKNRIAVREALAELRGELAGHREPQDASDQCSDAFDGYVDGIDDAIEAIDRLAARFKP